MKKIISFALISMLLIPAVHINTVTATGAVSELIKNLPSANDITASSAELRSKIENIDELIISENLNESDFQSEIWNKWVTVKDKNLYFLPKYEMIDIGNVALSKAYANEGETAKVDGRGLDDYFPYWTLENNDTTWKETIAIWKERTAAEVGADEIKYSDSGIPFSFPREQYYAIGTSGSSCSRILSLDAPKPYRSIAFAAATGNLASSFEIEFQYTEGTYETQSFTIPAGWGGTGNLMSNNGLWADKAAAVYSNGYGKFGIHWFEIATDANRNLKAIVFRDFNSQADYKVLAVTGCTDISQNAKDAQATEYALNFDGEEVHIDISSIAASKVSIDPDLGLDRKTMTLNQDDYFLSGNYYNSIAIDAKAAAEFVGEDNLVADKSRKTYRTDLSKGITLSSGNTKSIEFEPMFADEISFIAGSAGGTDTDKSWLELVYEDGTTQTRKFEVPGGYATTDTQRQRNDYLCDLKKYLSFGPENGYTYYPALPTMGLYSISLPNDTIHSKIKKVTFFCSGEKCEYKILALTIKKVGREQLVQKTEEQIAGILLDRLTDISAFARYDMVNAMLEILKKGGTDLNSIVGIDDYMQLDNIRTKEFVLYISPIGNDSNTGLSDQSPLKSLDAARGKIENIRETLTDNYPFVIRLMPGKYEEPMIFSGVWGTESSPIIIEGTDGAYLTGSKSVDIGSANAITDSIMKNRIPLSVQKNILEIDLTAQNIDTSALSVMEYDLFLNDKRQGIAQYPNGTDKYAYSAHTVTSGQMGSFRVNDDSVSRWNGVKPNDAYLGGYFARDYRYDNALLGAVDADGKMLTLSTNTTYGVGDSPFRWKAFHVAEELDEPGEWYLNRETGKLYYYPPYDLTDAKLEVAVTNNALVLLQDTEYITFRKIHFKNSAGVGIQADRNLSTKKSPAHITVENCIFSCLGSGIYMSMGVDYPEYWAAFSGGDNIRIENNSFVFMGGSAISLYGGDQFQLRTNNSAVNNNYIYAAGVKQREKYAVNLDYTIGTQMKNNTIHKTPAAAISYASNDLNISYNEIYEVLRENEDGGALYSGKSFIRRGNEVSYNYIHDGLPLGSVLYNTSNTAIYLDDGLSGQIVHHNIIDNFGCGILFSGVDNKITSNTVANSAVLSILAKDSESAMSSSSMRDAVTGLHGKTNWSAWVAHYPELALIYADSSKCTRNDLRDNLIDIPLHLKAPFQRAGMNTISDNQNYGYKNNSIFNESFLLKDSAASDYVTKRNGLLSEANFDMKQVGLTDLSNHMEIDRTFRTLYPSENAMVDSPHEQLFMWEDAAGADVYTLELATDELFQNVVYSACTRQNRLLVSDFNFENTVYYWRVMAKNNSASIANTWFSSNSPSRMFAAAVYQLEAVRKEFDISAAFNANAMIEENAKATSNTSNRYYEPYVMNKTFIKKLLNEKSQVHIGGIPFTLHLNGEKTAANNYNTSLTIDLENGQYDTLHFLAGNTGANADIQIVYENGEVDERALDFMTSSFGKLQIPNLRLSDGTPNAYESSILTASLQIDYEKVVDKIIIKPSSSNANAINLFAVTGTIYRRWIDQTGEYRHLLIENNSSAQKNLTVYQAIYNTDGSLENIQRYNVELDSEQQMAVNIPVLENKIVKQFIWGDTLLPEARVWRLE